MRTVRSALLGLVLFASAAWADPPHETFVDPPNGLQLHLMAGEFEDLEKIAADDLANHLRYRNGFWAITNFYEILARFHKPNGNCKVAGEYGFDDKRAAMERWLAAKPDSATPRIALAMLWKEYAWAGRGCGYASETRQEQFEAFQERLQKARDLLRAVDHEADPAAYSIEMMIAPSDEHPPERLAYLYERATHAFPSVPDYATSRYYYLLPRWFGEPGEAAAYARSLLTTPGGDLGLQLYFDVAQVAAVNATRDWTTLLGETGIDYPTLIKAYLTRQADFGPNVYDMNLLMYYAVAARDFRTADRLAGQIGDHWDNALWGGESDRAYRNGLLTWILGMALDQCGGGMGHTVARSWGVVAGMKLH